MDWIKKMRDKILASWSDIDARGQTLWQELWLTDDGLYLEESRYYNNQETWESNRNPYQALGEHVCPSCEFALDCQVSHNGTCTQIRMRQEK